MKLLGLGLVLVAACGPGGVAHEVRPAAPKGASAGVGTDLLVDLPSSERAEIELALRGGAFAVRVEGSRTVLLPKCRPRTSEVVWNDYGYGGIGSRPSLPWKVESFPAKHEIVKLRDASMLRAALPRTATALGVEVEAALERGASLDLALVSRALGRLDVSKAYLSQLTTSWPPKAADPCRDATHLITSVTFGAFALATVTGARESTAASIFGAGAASSSNSAREAAAHEGDLADCEAGNVAGHCAVPIRWTLAPLDRRYEAAVACEEKDDAAACGRWAQVVLREGDSAERTTALAKSREACRKGTLVSMSAAAAVAGEPCEAVVDAGARAGFPDDELDRAAELACLHGLSSGCRRSVDRARERGDYNGAFNTLSRQCQVRRGAWAIACMELVRDHETRPRPISDAPTLSRAWAAWCIHSGECERRPTGKWFDSTPFASLNEQALGLVTKCTGSEPDADECKRAAAAQAYGIGLPRDLAAAKRSWQTSCRKALAAGGQCPPFPYGR